MRSKIILNLNIKLLSGLINILLNGLIIRYVNLNIIGIANIRLKLYYRTILLFSRESLRRTIPNINNIHSIYHYINLIWLIIPLGLFFMSLSLLLILFIEKLNNENFGLYYNESCFTYFLSAFIELLSEPFYLLSIITENDYIHIYIEFIASIIGLGIQTNLILRNVESSLIYYAYEERYRLFIISSFNDLLIKFIYPFVDHKLFNKTIPILKQTISMKILREADLYIITIFSLISYEEQAIYHMIYLFEFFFPNFIFSTIQQISFYYFQQTFLRTNINRYMIVNSEYIQDDLILLKQKQKQKQDYDQSYYRYNQQPSTPNGIYIIGLFTYLFNN
ncbi:unnamed protein product [Rotaria sp. Silwood2]|nr:unnamed protein product [Rotaria sp. Silwood2]